MADHSPTIATLVLEDDPALGRISVDMEAFFDFSFWMAEELEDLKAQHRSNGAGTDSRSSRNNADQHGSQRAS